MRIHKICLSAAILAAVLMAGGCGGKAAGTAGTTASAETAEVAGTTAGVPDHSETPGAQSTSAVPGGQNTSAAPGGQVASENETVSPKNVVEAGMVPVYGTEIKDGVYPIKVDSSSSMFRITSCQLTVKDGVMSAVMATSGTGYLKLFMGTGEEAAQASEADCIPYVETADGAYTYAVPVEALDMGIDCSAFSKKKEKWYDRELVFRADSLPAEAFADGKIATAESLKLEDGVYTCEVRLDGGSGRAAVESPATLRVENKNVTATIVWGSANYDYMKVDGEKYGLAATGGNSTFEIPVTGFDWRMPVIADTIAMSQPHEIEYTLTFDSATLKRVD